jgi:hypothetical protein
MKRIFAGLFSVLILPIMSSAAVPEPPAFEQKNAIVFRFTGTEAHGLREFLQPRAVEALDSGLRYYGDRMSLACSVQDDCFLYLSQREWAAQRDPEAQTLTMDFTLPVLRTTLEGRLTVSSSIPDTSNRFLLQLKDNNSGEAFTFNNALDCPIQWEWKEEFLKGNGDCRLDFGAEKRYLTYQPSIQFVHNSENTAAVLRGPWAEKLFKAGGKVEVEAEPTHGRVTIGPHFYCWDLDLPGQEDLPLEERYMCQIKLVPASQGELQFVAEGSTADGEAFTFIMRPRFEKNLLHGFELIQDSAQGAVTIDYCPYDRKTDGPRYCSFALNYKRDVIYYPLWTPVQGVAVGWGVRKR